MPNAIVTVVALGILVLANLPLAYSLVRLKPSGLPDFWKLAPHHYFFSLFLVPVSALAGACGLVRAVTIARTVRAPAGGASGALLGVLPTEVVCVA